MKRTISIMLGKGSLRHNNRDFIAENVDAERTKDNIIYCHENIRTVYHELFDEALEKYNAKQTRKDRRIDDYYEKIRTGKQEKPFHEIIVQIGSMEDTHSTSENGALARSVLDKYMQGFRKRNPNLRVFSVHLHMDEATPHLHIDFVPFTTGSKRGLETRVSLKKALAAQGFVGEGRRDTEWSRWVESEKEQLAEVMQEHGIEWDKLGTHNKHRTVEQFKQDKIEEQIEKLQEKRDGLQASIDAYNDSVKRSLEFARRLEEKSPLPDAPALMAAKTYKKKYAEPLAAKVIEVIKSLARKVYELLGHIEQLKKELDQLRRENSRLRSDSYANRCEREQMRREIKAFDKIKKHFGADTVKQWLKEIDKQRKTRKRGLEEAR